MKKICYQWNLHLLAENLGNSLVCNGLCLIWHKLNAQNIYLEIFFVNRWLCQTVLKGFFLAHVRQKNLRQIFFQLSSSKVNKWMKFGLQRGNYTNLFDNYVAKSSKIDKATFEAPFFDAKVFSGIDVFCATQVKCMCSTGDLQLLEWLLPMKLQASLFMVLEFIGNKFFPLIFFIEDLILIS